MPIIFSPQYCKHKNLQNVVTFCGSLQAISSKPYLFQGNIALQGNISTFHMPGQCMGASVDCGVLNI